ncbi:phospholipid/cholesterol/gamma-HCH transport system substrate-binding protein [Amycolatopsis marina]|uniref:Phospholipid/cholesterol/gamma-HCH transport system substrate-binding protein n=1 Tax=Amycolatopsis marina TaxID=490629 RepID=A0A1I0ZV39_9PSEU|nr:MlaD family protein [Amycolatopsis marina]SFB28936.1 phospholipid/cholesterol/gamma-HCH transport system substrate-binding protein [Amycolatopsis marina]
MPRRRAHAAIVAVLLAGAIAGCGVSLQNTATLGGPGSPTYRVTAVFGDAAGLPLGGTVQIGQATVGRVADVRVADFHAHVDLDIHTDVALPEDTGARLELTSALGEEFVVLEPPAARAGGAALADGAVIPLERTSRGPDVENTLAAVGVLLNGSGIDQIRTIVAEANAAIGGRAGRINGLIAQLDTILLSLDDSSDEILGVIDSMRDVSAQLAENRPTLRAAFTEIEPAIRVLLAERERFGTLLADVTSLGRTTHELIERSGPDLTQQFRALRPVLDDLRALDGRLGTTLSGLNEFAGLLRQATPGDYLMLDGTLDVPLSVAEILSPDLFGTQPEQGDAALLLEGGTR